jgi:hypothetical protein
MSDVVVVIHEQSMHAHGVHNLLFAVYTFGEPPARAADWTNAKSMKCVGVRRRASTNAFCEDVRKVSCEFHQKTKITPAKLECIYTAALGANGILDSNRISLLVAASGRLRPRYVALRRAQCEQNPHL